MPTEAGDTLAALDALIERVRAAGPEVVGKGALAIQAAGMARTHVRSGTLRRSWHVEVDGNVAQVGPTTVYARRQELGFHGADALGRVYDETGWPYVRPAFDETAPRLNDFAVAKLTEAIGG